MGLLVSLGIILMAWYDPGSGAGDWQNAVVNPSLKNILHEICTAINEREVAASRNRVEITSGSLTRSGSTATVTSTAHGLATGDKVTIRGAAQSEYNGRQTITVTGADSFTFAVSGTPASPATGTIFFFKNTIEFTYNEDGDQKAWPAVSDFVGMPLSQMERGPERLVYGTLTPSAVTRSGSTATATVPTTAQLYVGDTIEVSGFDQAEYNGVFAILGITDATHFTYTVSGAPASPATGTGAIKRHGRLTRDGTTVTVRLPLHGLNIGSVIELSGATQTEYNGDHTISAIPTLPAVTSITRSGVTATVTTASAHSLRTNDVVLIRGCTETQYNVIAAVTGTPTATTFTYLVSGSPSSPASGSPEAVDLTRFEVEISDTPDTPATGDIKCTAHRRMIGYASHGGGVANFQCYEHGLTTGDYVEIICTISGYTDWSYYGTITTVGANAFTMAVSAPSLTPFAGGSGVMYVVKEGVFRRLIREIRTAIQATVAYSTPVKFVEDDGTYETAWTITTLLDETTAGSPWIDLKALARTDIDAVLLQIREAIDLLVITRSSMSLLRGDNQFALGDSSGGSPGAEGSWDTMIAAGFGAGTEEYVRRFLNLVTAPGSWRSVVDDQVEDIISQGSGLGDWIESEMTGTETNEAYAGSPTSEFDSFEVDDSFGNTITLNQSGDGSQSHSIACSSTDIGEDPTFEYEFADNASLPSNIPGVYTALTFTGARILRRFNWASGYVVRELVPGTHLTYG